MNFVLISLVVLSFFALSSGSSSGKVIELTDYTFDEQIEKSPIIMVLFYAPWCGKSKGYLQEFNKAAKLISQIGKPYVLAKIDATSQTEIADKVGIAEFPLVKLYLNKQVVPYDKKELNADLVVRFIDKQVRPPSVELTAKEEIEGLKKPKGMKCILLAGDAKLLEEFVEAAKIVKDIPFYHTSEQTAKEHFQEVSALPAVVFLKGSEKFVLTENIKRNTIDEFVKLNMFPIVTTFTQDVIAQILKPYGRTGVVLFRSATDPNAKKYEAEFHKLATAHKSLTFVFVVSDPTAVLDQKVAKYVGLEEMKLPLMVVLHKEEEIARYEYHGALTEEEMGKYLEDFKSGKLVQSLKSEEEPAENKGPVYTVVGKTFQRDVLDNDMDVFVKFYAPWCGHCKSLAPVFKQLAEKLKGNSKIKLVEIDSTKNEVPGHDVQSFPTLKLFVGGKKSEAIQYEQQRTEAAMLEFLKKNCKHEIIVDEKFTNGEESGAVKAEEKDDGGMCDSSCKDKEEQHKTE